MFGRATIRLGIGPHSSINCSLNHYQFPAHTSRLNPSFRIKDLLCVLFVCSFKTFTSFYQIIGLLSHKNVNKHLYLYLRYKLPRGEDRKKWVEKGRKETEEDMGHGKPKG